VRFKNLRTGYKFTFGYRVFSVNISVQREENKGCNNSRITISQPHTVCVGLKNISRTLKMFSWIVFFI
jgi:hypothetical protein